VARLGRQRTHFDQIGYQLAYAGDLPLVVNLADTGKKILRPISSCMTSANLARGVRRASRSGATFLTVHAYPANPEAAVAGHAAGSALKISAVRADLYDDGDLHAAASASAVSDLVEGPRQQAQVLGSTALVCPRGGGCLAQRLSVPMNL